MSPEGRSGRLLLAAIVWMELLIFIPTDRQHTHTHTLWITAADNVGSLVFNGKDFSRDVGRSPQENCVCLQSKKVAVGSGEWGGSAVGDGCVCKYGRKNK